MKEKTPSTVEDAQEILEEIRRKQRAEVESSEQLRSSIDIIIQQLDNPTHVIPELLQNADDLGKGCKKVEISLSEDFLSFKNEPPEMTANEVDSLCAIGKSTKKSLEFIGYFGIGFKTVFSVTNKPEVYSGYFSFKFSRDFPTVPISLEDKNKLPIRGTEIVLPFTEEAEERKREGLREMISEVNSLLPYLENISIIKVDTDEKTSVYKREKIDENTFIIKRDGDVSERRKVFSNGRELPKRLFEHIKKERKLKEVDLKKKNSLPVKISYRVDDEGTPKPNLEESRIFCYFPTNVRTYFPFDIQSDFLLNPDRKHLRGPNDPVNEWILGNVVDAFRKAYSFYVREGDYRPDFIELLPKDNEHRPDYLEQVKDEIIEFLDRQECILGEDGELHKPGKIVFLDERIRPLITQSMLQKLMKRDVYLPSKKIQEEYGKKLHKLGLGSLVSIEEFLEECSGKEIFEGKDKSWLIKFFSALYEHWDANYRFRRSYKSTKYSKEDFGELAKNLRVLPLQDRGLTSYNELEGKLFIPAKKDLSDYKVFMDKLKFIDSDFKELLTSTEDVGDEKGKILKTALSFIEEVLEIEELSDRSIVKKIINPEFEKCDEINNELLDKYINFIFNRKSLWNKAKVKFRRKKENAESTKYYIADELYFSDEYDLDYSLETILSDIEKVKFVSPHYLNLSESDGSMRWTNFLKSLSKEGVRDKIKIEEEAEREREKFRTEEDFKEHLKKNGWKNPKIKDSVINRTTKGEYGKWMNYNRYALIDKKFPAKVKKKINKLLNDRGKKSFEFFKNLSLMIDQNWDEYYQNYLTCDYNYNRKSGHYVVKRAGTDCPSSFANFLKEDAWLPSENGKIMPPKSLFKKNVITKEQPDVNFVEVGIKDDSFRKFLEIQTSLSLKATLDRLESIRKRAEEMSPEHIRKLISYHLTTIENELSSKKREKKRKYIERLKEARFIYVDGKEPEFRKCHEVFWEGKEDLGDFLIPIEGIYSDYKSLFLEKLKIKKRPNLSDFLDFFNNTISKNKDFDKIKAAWSKIVGKMISEMEELGEEQFKSNDDVERFKKMKIPNARKKLSKFSDLEYFCINKDIIKKLESDIKDKIVYPTNKDRFANFMIHLGLKSLRNNIKENLVSKIHLIDVESKFEKIIKELLNVTYSFLSKIESEEKEKFEDLSNYKIHHADKIKCFISLDDKKISKKYKSRSYINHDNREIILTENVDSIYSLAETISHFIDISNEHREELLDLLNVVIGKDQDLIESYLEKRNIEYQDISSKKKTTGVSEKVSEELESTKEQDTERKVWQEKEIVDEVSSDGGVKKILTKASSVEKKWKRHKLENGQEVYIDDKMNHEKINSVKSQLKPFKELMRDIVEAMGGNSDTVNICITDPKTDGHRKTGQLFFNVLRFKEDDPLRWLVVAARELAYTRYHNLSQPHIHLMTELIIKAIRKIDEIYSDFSEEID